jgi:hypothetical protein
MLTFDIGVTTRAGTFMRSDSASLELLGVPARITNILIHSPVKFAMFSLKLYMLPNLLSHIIGCDIRSFLDFANIHYRFVRKYCSIILLLTLLTHMGITFT